MDALCSWTMKSGGKTGPEKCNGKPVPPGCGICSTGTAGSKRTIASSVLVEGGDLPLVSVRTRGTIPKEQIFPVMEEIRKCQVKAPIRAGTVLIPNVLGLGADVIATKTVEKRNKRGAAGNMQRPFYRLYPGL
jgi:CxxC motif-containing protein